MQLSNQDKKLKEAVSEAVKAYQEDISEDLGTTEAAEFQGRKVTLDKPFRTPDAAKKFGVYVKNDKGNVVLVRFGDNDLSIKRDDPARRKAYFARFGKDPGPKWKAKYWSHWAWRPQNKLP